MLEVEDFKKLKVLAELTSITEKYWKNLQN